MTRGGPTAHGTFAPDDWRRAYCAGAVHGKQSHAVEGKRCCGFSRDVRSVATGTTRFTVDTVTVTFGATVQAAQIGHANAVYGDVSQQTETRERLVLECFIVLWFKGRVSLATCG
jgi:hypothetical protein